jgi:predicted ArsR family transcriptional regulator
MSMTPWDDRFFETTKGRILALLRRESRTVDELATGLGVTDNAVRGHLSVLERDGIVRQRGVRQTGGKPAYSYEIAPAAERMFSRAYVPVLVQLVAVLEKRLTEEELGLVFRDVGTRLAAKRPAMVQTRRDRAEVAASVLRELGGVVDVEEKDGTVMLRGFSCPLADAVRAHPGTCRAVEALVSELVGETVQESCDRGERPRCCFELLSSV